ncbi:MAG: hypothetical protein ACOYYS_01755 [Chloroflexota bacterium]
MLIIAGWNLRRLVETLSQWPFLVAYTELSPLYLALSGLFWSVAGLLVGWGLWRCKAWASLSARFFNLAYVLYLWIDRIFLQHSFLQGGWLIPLVLSLFWLAFTFFATRKPL